MYAGHHVVERYRLTNARAYNQSLKRRGQLSSRSADHTLARSDRGLYQAWWRHMVRELRSSTAPTSMRIDWPFVPRTEALFRSLGSPTLTAYRFPTFAARRFDVPISRVLNRFTGAVRRFDSGYMNNVISNRCNDNIHAAVLSILWFCSLESFVGGFRISAIRIRYRKCTISSMPQAIKISGHLN